MVLTVSSFQPISYSFQLAGTLQVLSCCSLPLQSCSSILHLLQLLFQASNFVFFVCFYLFFKILKWVTQNRLETWTYNQYSFPSYNSFKHKILIRSKGEYNIPCHVIDSINYSLPSSHLCQYFPLIPCWLLCSSQYLTYSSPRESACHYNL